jgi:hypothetical protein
MKLGDVFLEQFVSYWRFVRMGRINYCSLVDASSK